jgi:hypothetical protein
MIGQIAFWPGMRDFKTIQCNENQLIAGALRSFCQPWLKPPILDVGAGLGDIAAAAFSEHDAVLLDNYQRPERVGPRHRYVADDFYIYRPKLADAPRTVFLCHVLQYLDDDWAKFSARIDELNPETVIAVTNDNDGEFGEIISWGLEGISGINAEASGVELNHSRYALAKKVPFNATLECATFEIMTLQLITGILDAPATAENFTAALTKIRSMLDTPRLTINETIYCYERRK